MRNSDRSLLNALLNYKGNSKEPNLARLGKMIDDLGVIELDSASIKRNKTIHGKWYLELGFKLKSEYDRGIYFIDPHYPVGLKIKTQVSVDKKYKGTTAVKEIRDEVIYRALSKYKYDGMLLRDDLEKAKYMAGVNKGMYLTTFLDRMKDTEIYKYLEYIPDSAHRIDLMSTSEVPNINSGIPLQRELKELLESIIEVHLEMLDERMSESITSTSSKSKVLMDVLRFLNSLEGLVDIEYDISSDYSGDLPGEFDDMSVISFVINYKDGTTTSVVMNVPLKVLSSTDISISYNYDGGPFRETNSFKEFSNYVVTTNRDTTPDEVSDDSLSNDSNNNNRGPSNRDDSSLLPTEGSLEDQMLQRIKDRRSKGGN